MHTLKLILVEEHILEEYDSCYILYWEQYYYSY